MSTEFDSVKDSGEREEFATGSRRDTRKGKGRFDLITPIGLRRLATHYENGAIKYGDRNWEKGQPLGRYLDSAMRHIVCLLAGEKDEDHASAVAWNALSFMHTADMIEAGKLPRELDDIGFTQCTSQSVASGGGCGDAGSKDCGDSAGTIDASSKSTAMLGVSVYSTP